MTNKPRHPHRKPLWQKLAKIFRPWHRRLGIASALLVVMVAVTGVLINHSNDFALDSAHVHQGWLLDHYGIKAPGRVAIFETQPLLASSDNLLWLKGKPVLEAQGPLLGALAYGEHYVAIDAQHLYLLSQDGALLEQQGRATGLPQNLRALGLLPTGDGQQLWLDTDSGSYLSDADLIEWQAAQPLVALDWQAPLADDKSHALIQELSLSARAMHLTWERVLLDLHSGRIVGLAGSLMMDLVALCLIFMAISGLYLWQQAKPKKRRK
ncbi:PepSY-associated TM helix domain-containing protein [Shewanella sp. Isolate7]|uniref:PepSY-associated TM helix domain-containing protein n=1 Tax=Shewanella sp. Isolate7 TaxID=2908528 RepID=UPI001EFCF4B2|nr:PepSY-associated TM helix domain-containing protein [Shewanella sp. Isolate7]MCG9720987.1 PepSY-associated TM helix domain-containing protein [Shewanella sp. Isolate7]